MDLFMKCDIRIWESNEAIFSETVFSNPAIILKVITSDAIPIAKPITARRLAYEEKLPLWEDFR